MPVLIERTSVIVPSRLLARAGDLPAAIWRKEAVADDGEVVAVALSGTRTVQEAIEFLARAGLHPLRDGEPGEVAVAGQFGGPLLWWPWLEFAVLQPHGPEGAHGRVLAARRAGTGVSGLATPPGWSFTRSASDAGGVAPLSLVDRPLHHVRRDPGADVYLDRWTGEELRLERSNDPVRVTVRARGGPGGEVLAEVVEGDDEVEMGLMFRESLAPGSGMLFRFAASRVHEFWMKNTLVPLDILFIGADGRVVNVAARTEPLRLRHHGSGVPVRAVLEVPAGWCAAHGVGAGALVTVEQVAAARADTSADSSHLR